MKKYIFIFIFIFALKGNDKNPARYCVAFYNNEGFIKLRFNWLYDGNLTKVVNYYANLDKYKYLVVYDAYYSDFQGNYYKITKDFKFKNNKTASIKSSKATVSVFLKVIGYPQDIFNNYILYVYNKINGVLLQEPSLNPLELEYDFNENKRGLWLQLKINKEVYVALYDKDKKILGQIQKLPKAIQSKQVIKIKF